MADVAVKSARRGFEVLEYFETVRAPLTLKQTCDKLGYPPSSGAAIMKSLVTLGYLEYDKRSRTYLPTMRIAGLGSWVQTDLFGDMNILGFMEELRSRTNETVVLAAQSDLNSQYVHVIHSCEERNKIIGSGMSRPLAKARLGHLFLTQYSTHSIEHIVRRINAANGPGNNKINIEELLDSVDTIRNNGYCVAQDVFVDGFGVVGMLMPETRFKRRFAVGLGGTSAWITREEQHLRSLLKEAIAKFTRTLH